MDYTVSTRYYGPTDTKGARVKATCGALGELTVPYDYTLNQWQRHVSVACQLMSKKLGVEFTENDLEGGGLKEEGYVFLFSDKKRWLRSV